MTIAQAYKAHDMYHADELPRRVETQAEHDALAAAGWTKEYQHQAFPTTVVKNDEDGVMQSQQVADADARASAKKDGWLSKGDYDAAAKKAKKK